MDYIILGKNIKRVRKSKALTQESLSERAGISTVFMSQIETASRKPSLETVVNIANSLNVAVDELIYNKSSQEQLREAVHINFSSEQLIILSKLFDKRTTKEINSLFQAFGVLLDSHK
jgi:transcriptional regulator with XRE-family HTH domain